MEDCIYKNFDTEKIEKKLKGRIKPKIYAFKTNTVPSFVKIGETYRTVDERLSEWSKIYNDIFEYEDKKDKQHNPFFVDDSILKNNKDVYFRDLSIHKYLRSKNKHQFEESDREKYKISKDLYISKEFYLGIEKKDLNNAIRDINEKFDKKSEYYDYYDINTKENKEIIYDNQIELIPRKEQQKVIDLFINKYKKLSKREFPKRYLIYAVMRFGKTFTSLCCAKEMGAKVVLVVSAKADVKNEWKKNVESVVNFKEYKFLDEKQLKHIKIKDILKGKYNNNKENSNEPDKNKVVIFLTLQDLKDVKKKFKELYKTKIDMLIVDETHFGAWAAKLGDIVDKAKNSDINDFENEDKDNLSKIANYDDANTIDDEDCYSEDLVRQLKVKIIMHLSGTPYNLLLRNKFSEDDILAEITYSDILDYKKEWNDRFLRYEYIEDITNKNDLNEILRIKHYKSYNEYKNVINELFAKISSVSNFKDKEKYKNEYSLINKINEFENPYFGFPEMLRFAFNPTEESYKKIEKLKKQDGSISLSLIFRPKSLKKIGKYKEFENKDIVLSILQSLDGKKEDKNVFPILDYVKNKNRNIARHMVFVLPFCASCDALQELIKKNKFNNLNEYKIINISGLDIEKEYENIENIKETISECEKNNVKTITLTVERMLTGTTVPEWDTMVFFRDIQSAEHYDQAIYRLQNPFVQTIKSENGNYVKIDNKPQTLLIDFSLSRMFSFTEKRLFLQNVNQGKKDDGLEEKIKYELQKSPIFVLKGQKMVDVEPTDLMSVVAKYSGYRSIIDDASEIRFNIDILENDKLRDVIESQEVYDNGKFGLNINKFSDKNRQKISTILKKHKGEIVDIDNDDNDNKNKKKLDDYEILRKQWKVYWSRILFFAFLTKSTICRFKDMINILQNDIENFEDNKRILKNLNIDLKYLKLFYNLLSPEEVQNISNQILNKNKLSHEEYLDDKEIRNEFDRKLKKVEVAISSFSRLGKSEIVTPMKVCQEMISSDIISDVELDNIINTNKCILDINSKVAEFTFAFVKRLVSQGGKDKYVIGDKRICNLFYSIVSSRHAYEFTRYVYELLGLNIDNISFNFTSYDLVNDDNVHRKEGEKDELKKQKNNIKDVLRNIQRYYNFLNKNNLSEKEQRKKNAIDSLKELIGTDKINNCVVKDYQNGLNEELKIVERKLSENIDYNKINRILNQNKRFSDIKLSDKVKENDNNMRFQIVIGNPPYQEESSGGRISDQTLYNYFMEIAYNLSPEVVTITPARFLFNNGLTPKQWNEKMLNDNHIRVVKYESDGKKVFENVGFKGGVVIIERNTRICYEPINNFSPYDELNSIRVKVENKHEKSITSIMFNQNLFNLEVLYTNFPNLKRIVSSDGKERRLTSGCLKYDCFKDKKGKSDLTIIGRIGDDRVYKYIEKKYINMKHDNIEKYKVIIPANNGSGAIGEVVSTPLIGEPLIGFTQTFISVGAFDTKKQAENALKYIKSKFCRTMLGILKVTQNGKREVWKYVPLQDFTNKSDIDWSKSIENIDKQLYKKYKLTKEEIAFIEKNIKPMK